MVLLVTKMPYVENYFLNCYISNCQAELNLYFLADATPVNPVLVDRQITLRHH